MRINFIKIDSGSKNRCSILQKYQAFPYSIGDVSDTNGYKLPIKYRKISINFAEIGILEVKAGVDKSLYVRTYVHKTE